MCISFTVHSVHVYGSQPAQWNTTVKNSAEPHKSRSLKWKSGTEQANNNNNNHTTIQRNKSKTKTNTTTTTGAQSSSNTKWRITHIRVEQSSSLAWSLRVRRCDGRSDLYLCNELKQKLSMNCWPNRKTSLTTRARAHRDVVKAKLPRNKRTSE